MKLFIILLFLFGLINNSTAQEKNVSNIRVSQEGDKVSINYDLKTSTFISLIVFEEDKQKFGFNISGDIGYVEAGNLKKITLIPDNENMVCHSCVFRVIGNNKNNGAPITDDIVSKHINAIGGAENWKKIKTLKQEATISVQGMDIPIVITFVHNKAFKQEFTVMGMTGYSIITADGGWNFSPMAGQTKPEPITADELKNGKDQLDLQGELIDYFAKGHRLEVLPKENVDGRECHVVKIKRKTGTETVFYFDPKTYYIIRTKSKVVADGKEVESIVNMSNFKKLPEGIVMPFTIENSAVPAPITVTKVVINGPVNDATFKVSQVLEEEF